MTPRARPSLFDCRTCNRFKWNDPMKPQLGVGGGCHSRPPVPLVVGANQLGQPVIMAYWPPVGAGDYCFDHPFAQQMTAGLGLRASGPVEPLQSVNGHGPGVDDLTEAEATVEGEALAEAAPKEN